MKKLAIVVRDDAYDRLLTPLTFAWVTAKEGAEVDVLFVLWAVRALTPQGLRELKVDAHHADEAAWLRERLARNGNPAELHDFLRALKHTGKVRFYACRLAAQTFDVAAERLIEEAEGIVDSSWFLKEKALPADHCQYF